MNTDITKDVKLTTQVNSALTPKFAYFNDTLRDALRGSTFMMDTPGFVTGAINVGDKLESCFRGLPFWCADPCQTINYVSCHDNNTFFDRIALSCPKRSLADRIRMYKLGAAFYITAQGIPFMHAGEEMLRSKPAPKGGFVENSYKSPDSVNAIRWNQLRRKEYKNTLAYYKGLIQFRKAHPVLRMTKVVDILSSIMTIHCSHPQLGAFHLRSDMADETAREMLLIFSAAETVEKFTLPEGKWNLCVNAEKAGTKTLQVCEGTVEIPPICAMIFTKA